MKKFLTVIVSLIIAASLCLNSFASYIYGDVTGDKKINSSDALRTLMHSTGLTTLKGDQRSAADVNADNRINSSDALLILNYSVGNINIFPAEQGGDPDVDHNFYG